MKETKAFRWEIYFSFLLLFFGCSTPKNEIIEISPEYFVDEQLSLSDIADDVHYIPLDSQVLIPSIVSLELSDSLIFIAAGVGTGVLEFNQFGSFIRKIGNVGKGPGEYLRSSSITVDSENRRIWVSDFHNLLAYGFNGRFIRTINNPNLRSFHKVSFLGNKLYLFSLISNSKSNSPYYWTVLDTLGNELFSKKNTTFGFLDNNNTTMIFGNIAYKFGKKLFYWNHYNDTIFELSDTIYKSRYLFKNDQFRITPEIASKPDYRFGQDQRYVLEKIFESNHFLFIKYFQNKENCLCIYDKTENKFKSMTFYNPDKKAGLNNDLDSGLSFLPLDTYNFSNEEYLVSWKDAYELKAHVASEAFKNSTPKYPEKKKALEKLANSLNENDNPVLMLVKLKE